MSEFLTDNLTLKFWKEEGSYFCEVVQLNLRSGEW